MRNWWVCLSMACLVVVTGCAHTGTSSSQSAAEVNAQLGLGYIQEGDYEQALKKLQHALELDDHSANAHHYIALVYQRLGQNKEAESHYRKALDNAPNDADLLVNYGIYLCRQKRLDEADGRFRAAIKQPFYRTPELAYLNAGRCSLGVPDIKKAEDYFRAALRVSPNMAGALYELAELKFNTREYLPARAFLQRYSEAAPASAASLWLGVQIERALGDEIAADKYAAQLKQQFPGAEETALLLQGRKQP